jgi:hypothetical protein
VRVEPKRPWGHRIQWIDVVLVVIGRVVGFACAKRVPKIPSTLIMRDGDTHYCGRAQV